MPPDGAPECVVRLTGVQQRFDERHLVLPAERKRSRRRRDERKTRNKGRLRRDRRVGGFVCGSHRLSELDLSSQWSAK